MFSHNHVVLALQVLKKIPNKYCQMFTTDQEISQHHTMLATLQL